MTQLHPATDLLVLPETFSTGFPAGMDKEAVRAMAERNTGHTIEFLKELANLHSVGIAGTYIADSGGSLYNRAFFIEPGGGEVLPINAISLPWPLSRRSSHMAMTGFRCVSGAGIWPWWYVMTSVSRCGAET